MNHLLTADEVAAYIQRPKSMIYKWTCAKKIPFSKINGGLLRFNKEKIDKWIEGMSFKPIAS